jgi:hypothetical protein
MGLKGGHFFPLIFASVCLGMGISLVFFPGDLSHATLAAGIVAASTLATTMKKPLAVAMLLMLCICFLDALLELQDNRTSAVYDFKSKIPCLDIGLRRLSMSPYQKHFSCCIHHLVHVFLVYGHKALGCKSGQLCVIMYDGSEREKPFAVLCIWVIVLEEFFRLAYGLDDSCTESRIPVNIYLEHKYPVFNSRSVVL